MESVLLPVCHAYRILPPLQMDAWTAIAALTADFIAQGSKQGAGAKVAKAMAATATFVAPIVAAFSLEGSRHFNAPRQINGPRADTV
jgi:hypothetical protein